MVDHAKELVEFLAKYQWTWEVKITRFFVDNHWQRIPIEVNVQLGYSSYLDHTCFCANSGEK